MRDFHLTAFRRTVWIIIKFIRFKEIKGIAHVWGQRTKILLGTLINYIRTYLTNTIVGKIIGEFSETIILTLGAYLSISQTLLHVKSLKS